MCVLAYRVSLWAFHGLATHMHQQCLLYDLQYCTVKKGSRNLFHSVYTQYCVSHSKIA
jgi:hypothetical protein